MTGRASFPRGGCVHVCDRLGLQVCMGVRSSVALLSAGQKLHDSLEEKWM